MGAFLIIIGVILLILVLIRSIKLVIKKEKKTDKTTLKLAGLAVVLFIAGGVLLPDNKSETEEKESPPKSEEVDGKLEEEKEEVEAPNLDELSPEEKFAIVIKEAVGETSNTEQKRIEDIKFFDDSHGRNVLITLNADENFTKGLTRSGILRYSANLIEAFRENSYDGDISLMWNLPLTDAYGNTKNGKVMSFDISKEVMEKINFENFDYKKLEQITDNYFEHPALRK